MPGGRPPGRYLSDGRPAMVVPRERFGQNYTKKMITIIV